MIYKIHYQYINLEIVCIFTKSRCFENSNRFLNFFASKRDKKGRYIYMR